MPTPKAHSRGTSSGRSSATVSRRVVRGGAIAAVLVVAGPLSAGSAFGEPVALDASGVSFSFIDADANDVLVRSEEGDSFLYENVATIGDVTIDGLLTVTETFNLVDDSLNVGFYDRAVVDVININREDETPGSPDLVMAGCYEDAPETSFLAQPDDYLVGSDVFDSSTAFLIGSDFRVGSILSIADEAKDDSDDEEDSAINTEIRACGGFVPYPDPSNPAEYSFPGYVRFSIDFTDAATDLPVLLTNLNLSAFDIDGGQYLRMFDPLPDSFEVFDVSLLDICGPAPLVPGSACAEEGDYAGTSSFLSGNPSLEFYGDDSSDDDEVYEWAAVARYTTPTSTVSYQFGVRDGGGGSLEVRFDDIDWDGGSGGGNGRESAPTLAQTGIPGESTLQITGLALAAFALGGLLVVIGRNRKQAPRGLK
jgi:hypothetical protein